LASFTGRDFGGNQQGFKEVTEMSGSDTIQRLLDQVEELYVHPRNQENLKKWVPQPKRALDNKWRGVPVPVDVANGQIPVVVNMEPSLRSAIFGYSVKGYFHNPEVYLENYLKHEIYHFTEIQDDVPILLHIPVYRSAYFEATLCGAEIVYLDDHDAVLPDTPHLKDLSDVGALPLVDFSQGEAMSYAKQLYEYVCEQVRGREFTVSFMEWLRNPFGVATWLYGEEKLLTAMTSDPEGVHRLMNYTTESRKKWTRQRAEYLDEEDYVTAGMYSDSVRGTSISSQQYLEFVRPYEMEIAELHGGIYYWHCCGDTTKLLEQLGGLPLELFHVGPWTDVRKAAEVFGPQGVALETCVQKHGHYCPSPWPAAADVFRATPKDIESKVRQIVRQAAAGGATAFFIEAGPLHRTHGAEQDVKTIKQWVHTTRTVLANLDELSV
jgi:uroporphyrinogen-III decarboxylase